MFFFPQWTSPYPHLPPLSGLSNKKGFLFTASLNSFKNSYDRHLSSMESQRQIDRPWTCMMLDLGGNQPTYQHINNVFLCYTLQIQIYQLLCLLHIQIYKLLHNVHLFQTLYFFIFIYLLFFFFFTCLKHSCNYIDKRRLTFLLFLQSKLSNTNSFKP